MPFNFLFNHRSPEEIKADIANQEQVIKGYELALKKTRDQLTPDLLKAAEGQLSMAKKRLRDLEAALQKALAQ